MSVLVMCAICYRTLSEGKVGADDVCRDCLEADEDAALTEGADDDDE